MHLDEAAGEEVDELVAPAFGLSDRRSRLRRYHEDGAHRVNVCVRGTACKII